MSGYSSACAVEARGQAILWPFVKERMARDGQFVLIDKGPIAKHLQETIGDLVYNCRNDGGIRSIELKVEEKWTGNLFLETWSNYCVGDPERRAAGGMNPGWIYKTTADYLWYYFLDEDYLFICNMGHLQRWAFGEVRVDGGHKRLERINLMNPKFRWVVQSKNIQHNTTVGAIVPVPILIDYLGDHHKILRPRAMLQHMEEAA